MTAKNSIGQGVMPLNSSGSQIRRWSQWPSTLGTVAGRMCPNDVLGAGFCAVPAGAQVIEAGDRRIPSPDGVEIRCHISLANNRISSDASVGSLTDEVGECHVHQASASSHVLRGRGHRSLTAATLLEINTIDVSIMRYRAPQ